MTHFDMVQIPKLIAFTTYYIVIYLSGGWKKLVDILFIYITRWMQAKRHHKTRFTRPILAIGANNILTFENEDSTISICNSLVLKREV